MTMICYVIEITAAIDDAGTTTTLLLTDGEGWTTKPTDTPANTHVMPRIKQAANYRRDLFARGAKIKKKFGLKLSHSTVLKFATLA